MHARRNGRSLTIDRLGGRAVVMAEGLELAFASWVL